MAFSVRPDLITLKRNFSVYLVQGTHLSFFFFVFVDKQRARSKREVFDLPSPVNYQQDYVIETLVVADKKMTDFHGVEELKTYVPSLINIVSNCWGKSWYGIFFPCCIAILI